MAIEQNFATFRDNTFALVQGFDGLEDLTIDIGADQMSKASPPPKVVIVLDPNEQITGTKGFGGAASFGKQNPQILFTRVVRFDAHVWGKDREQTEQLINHVAYGIHLAGWGAYDIKGGTWKGEDGSVNNLGTYYVMHAEMWIPVTRAQRSVRIGITLPITPADPMAVA